jgi:two-component system, sensor histidine kinase and response regulator
MPNIEESRFPTAAILAVDDYPTNLLALSAILEPLRCRVVTAQSGSEALERAAGREFAVILLDVMMPEMDGFETLARLRSIPAAKHVPVVLVTAYELDARAMERVQGLGTVDYILKPLPPELLRSKVAAFVSLHERGEELHRQREELRRRDEALAAKDRDIAMLAHDLQNPLTTIAMSASLLLHRNLDLRHQNAAQRISRGVGRMSEMIRSLTDYARAGRGAIPIAPEPTDLGRLCREIVQDFQNAESAGRLDLGCSGDLHGEWDRNRLYQAISNLVSNALRHGEGAVIVRAQAADSRVEVAVHNSGPAIPADRLPVIFEPFERGGQDRAGLGLGLYIVREIAKAHGGEVTVTSSVEKGTTFVLRLPRDKFWEAAASTR